MQNKTNIIIGIVAFLLLVTVPFWSAIFTSGEAMNGPELSYDTPVINAMVVPHCVEDVDYMRANHMNILNDWKVEVVREGNRVYVASDGTEYLASLQNTCFECHSNYEDFCLECHNYSGVTPTCWECHVEPSVTVAGGAN